MQMPRESLNVLAGSLIPPEIWDGGLSHLMRMLKKKCNSQKAEGFGKPLFCLVQFSHWSKQLIFSKSFERSGRKSQGPDTGCDWSSLLRKLLLNREILPAFQLQPFLHRSWSESLQVGFPILSYSPCQGNLNLFPGEQQCYKSQL